MTMKAAAPPMIGHAGMNWFETRLSPFESDWMALHRFLWLNALSGPVFWAILKARKSASAAAVPKCQDFGEAMQKWAATASAGRSVAAKRPQALLGDWADLFADFSAIRYCPECLAAAFHSHLFQVTAIARCPAHGHTLITTCRHCGASLEGTSSRAASFVNPFACDHCGNAFGIKPSAMLAADEPTRELDIFSELDREFRQACTSHVRCNGFLEHDARPPRFSRLVCQSMFEAALDQCRSKALFGEQIAHSCVAAAPDGWDDMAFGEQLRFNVRILKSIDRALLHRLNRICKHRRPAALQMNNSSGKFSALEHSLVMRVTDCPCCAALSWWRAEVSKVFALAKRVAVLEGDGLTVADRDGHYEREFSLHPRAFAFAALSTITSMAHAVAEVIELRCAESVVGGRGTRLDHQALSRPIGLPICRYRLEPSTVEIDRDGRVVTFAYSLDSAIEALRSATMTQQRRFQDRLMKHHPGPTDKWYLHLGEYALGPHRNSDWLSLSRRPGAGRAHAAPQLAVPKGLEHVFTM